MLHIYMIKAISHHSLQAHDMAVRSMIWSHNDLWMLTADHGGFVKYWQSNMNNVKMYQAHKDPVRGLRWGSATAERERHLFILRPALQRRLTISNPATTRPRNWGAGGSLRLPLVVGYRAVCLAVVLPVVVRRVANDEKTGNAVKIVCLVLHC